MTNYYYAIYIQYFICFVSLFFIKFGRKKYKTIKRHYAKVYFENLDKWAKQRAF